MTELKPAGLFVTLLAAELQTINLTAKTIRFHPGEVVFRQGDPGDGIYCVEEGEVEIRAIIQDQQRVLSRLGPTRFFGEMAVIDDQPRSATAVAVAETVLSFTPCDELLRALDRSPRLLLSLMREFSQRMRDIDRRFLDEILQAERLALVGRFAQSIVHDFKNPLNMIGFAADMAAGEDAAPEHRAEARTVIRRQVDRLANMINELLEFTRGSSASPVHQRVDYGAFIDEALREIRVEAGQ